MAVKGVEKGASGEEGTRVVVWTYPGRITSAQIVQRSAIERPLRSRSGYRRRLRNSSRGKGRPPILGSDLGRRGGLHSFCILG